VDSGADDELVRRNAHAGRCLDWGASSPDSWSASLTPHTVVIGLTSRDEFPVTL
jgi:hypothetical protein